MTDMERRLAVVPSESIETYLSSGYARHWLQSYYNPNSFFTEVYLLSPREKTERHELGMHIIPTKEGDFRKRIRDLGIDVVRAYGGYWACDLACNRKVSNVLVVVSIHDRREEWLHDTIRKADAVFCTSKIVKEMVLRRSPASERVWILPNRVNLDVMHPRLPRQCADLSDQYPYPHRILHVGRKSREKNLDTVVKTLRILGEEYCLLTIGMGDTQECLELARQQGVSRRLFSINTIPNEDLARYYCWADCLCNPSRAEGFGMIFIEALACETVVVTSDIAPMNEFIRHMENGLLVKDYEDPAAIAEMIRLACTDEAVRRTLKANARQSVARFEKSRVDALEADYYQTVLDMRREGRFRIPLWARAARSVETDIKRLTPMRLRKAARRVLTRLKPA